MVAPNVKKWASEDDITASYEKILGAPALLPGESLECHRELMIEVTGQLNLTNPLECLWARDIVDLYRDVERLRRFRAQFIKAVVGKELLPRLSGQIEDEAERRKLIAGWARGEDSALRQLYALLAAQGLDIESLIAQTSIDHIDTLERLDDQIMRAEGRRHVAIRELQRYRAAAEQQPSRHPKVIEGR